jgi:hypothetical protein
MSSKPVWLPSQSGHTFLNSGGGGGGSEFKNWLARFFNFLNFYEFLNSGGGGVVAQQGLWALLHFAFFGIFLHFVVIHFYGIGGNSIIFILYFSLMVLHAG